jgi:hypothetical protein
MRKLILLSLALSSSAFGFGEKEWTTYADSDGEYFASALSFDGSTQLRVYSNRIETFPPSDYSLGCESVRYTKSSDISDVKSCVKRTSTLFVTTGSEIKFFPTKHSSKSIRSID